MDKRHTKRKIIMSRLACLIFILFLFSAISGCIIISKDDDSGIPGFYDSFLVLETKSANEMKIEIEGINKSLAAASMKMAKLEQVGKVCQDWIALQKSNADREQWGPRILGVGADLSKLTNDQYRVIKLEFIVEPSSARKYTNVIMVMDAITGKQSPYEDMRTMLKTELDNLKKLGQSRLNAMEFSFTTASTVLDQYQTWKASKASDSNYSISGPALGYYGTTLAQGQWTYNANTKIITPIDNSSSSLERIIRGH